jgi:hypothetical protein
MIVGHTAKMMNKRNFRSGAKFKKNYRETLKKSFAQTTMAKRLQWI